METILFPYVIEGKSKNLAIRVSGEVIGVLPILAILGLKWQLERVHLKPKYDINVAGRVEPAVGLSALENWLGLLKPSASKEGVLTQHFRDHLCAALVSKSSSLGARAREQSAAVTAAKGAVALIGAPLEAIDHFRRDASLGSERIQPDLIAKVAHRGVLDLFVRPARNTVETVGGETQVTTVPEHLQKFPWE